MIFVWLAVIVLGAVIVGGIDRLIGIRFTDVGEVPAIIHKVTYMAWGAVFTGITRRLFSF